MSIGGYGSGVSQNDPFFNTLSTKMQQSIREEDGHSKQDIEQRVPFNLDDRTGTIKPIIQRVSGPTGLVAYHHFSYDPKTEAVNEVIITPLSLNRDRFSISIGGVTKQGTLKELLETLDAQAQRIVSASQQALSKEGPVAPGGPGWPVAPGGPPEPQLFPKDVKRVTGSGAAGEGGGGGAGIGSSAPAAPPQAVAMSEEARSLSREIKGLQERVKRLEDDMYESEQEKNPESWNKENAQKKQIEQELGKKLLAFQSITGRAYS